MTTNYWLIVFLISIAGIGLQNHLSATDMMTIITAMGIIAYLDSKILDLRQSRHSESVELPEFINEKKN